MYFHLNIHERIDIILLEVTHPYSQVKLPAMLPNKKSLCQPLTSKVWLNAFENLINKRQLLVIYFWCLSSWVIKLQYSFIHLHLIIIQNSWNRYLKFQAIKHLQCLLKSHKTQNFSTLNYYTIKITKISLQAVYSSKSQINIGRAKHCKVKKGSITSN